MSKLVVRRRGYALGAEISGVDASKRLDEETIEQIRKAWLDHIIVYLPGQDLSPEQFRAFSAQFGELDTETNRRLPRHPDMPEIVVRANKPVAFAAGETAKSPPADKWHSDFSHTVRPATMTFLLGKELPRIGGDTMFANMYLAYETLSPAYQRIIEQLSAVHDVAHGRYEDGDDKYPAVHPVVKTHPDTGRKHLFVADRIKNFVGMTDEESQPLLDFLLDHATRYEFIYRHRWTPGDLLMWDNQPSLHYAVQDYDAETRMMFRAALLAPKSGHHLTETGLVPAMAAG